MAALANFKAGKLSTLVYSKILEGFACNVCSAILLPTAVVFTIKAMPIATTFPSAPPLSMPHTALFVQTVSTHNKESAIKSPLIAPLTIPQPDNVSPASLATFLQARPASSQLSASILSAFPTQASIAHLASLATT